jgi:hypothetical protein
MGNDICFQSMFNLENSVQSDPKLRGVIILSVPCTDWNRPFSGSSMGISGNTGLCLPGHSN